MITGKSLTYIGKLKKEKKKSDFKKDKTGEIHMSNGYGTVEILEHKGCHNCKIKFLEDGVILDNQEYGRVKRGEIRNPYKRVYYNKGYMGVGKYDSVTSPIAYKKWQNMLQRSYDLEYHKIYPSYTDVEICDDWQCFQNFATWFESKYNPATMQGWALDKDLFGGTNKIYSPETCCIIPQDVNASIVNMYKPICMTKLKERYYPNIMIKGDRVPLKVCDSYEEAVNVGIEKRKECVLGLLSMYGDRLDLKIVNKIIAMTTIMWENIINTDL